MAIEIVICGSRAKDLLGVDLEPWCWTEVPIAGVKVQAARIEPLAGDAYALLAPDAVMLRQMLAEQGATLTPDDVDRLRIQARIPAFPNEINEDHNPWEAGLDGAISLEKGCYVGQEVIARLHTYEKVRRKLVALKLAAPMERGAALAVDGKEVGVLTTVVGTDALAYIAADHAEPGTNLGAATVV